MSSSISIVGKTGKKIPQKAVITARLIIDQLELNCLPLTQVISCFCIGFCSSVSCLLLHPCFFIFSNWQEREGKIMTIFIWAVPSCYFLLLRVHLLLPPSIGMIIRRGKTMMTNCSQNENIWGKRGRDKKTIYKRRRSVRRGMISFDDVLVFVLHHLLVSFNDSISDWLVIVTYSSCSHAWNFSLMFVGGEEVGGEEKVIYRLETSTTFTC